MQNTTSLTDLTETEGKFAQTLLTALQTQTKLDESKYKDLVTDDDSGYRVQYALTQLKKRSCWGVQSQSDQ